MRASTNGVSKSGRTVFHLFQAFSEPLRMRIIRLLLDGDLRAVDLIKALKAPEESVYAHIAYLHHAKVIDIVNVGLWPICRLRQPDRCCHQRLLECLRECLSDIPQLQADRRRAEKIRRAIREASAVISRNRDQAELPVSE